SSTRRVGKRNTRERMRASTSSRADGETVSDSIVKEHSRRRSGACEARSRNLEILRSATALHSSRFACPGMTRKIIPAARSARGFASHRPSLGKRAQGKPGADCARSPVCESRDKKAHGLNYRYSRDIPAFPAQWFYGLCRALPGEAAFLAPVAGGIVSAGGAPGARRQGPPTLPYAC